MKHETLAEALPHEIARVRDVVMPAYREIGEPGIYALTMMELSIIFAERAISNHVRALADLRGYSL